MIRLLESTTFEFLGLAARRFGVSVSLSSDISDSAAFHGIVRAFGARTSTEPCAVFTILDL